VTRSEKESQPVTINRPPAYPDEYGVPEIITEQEKYGAEWPPFLSLSNFDFPQDTYY
jgi:hypothetical protein